MTPARRIPGEPGIWLIIFGEMTVFSTLFAAFLYYRAENPALFAAGRATLHRPIGIADTLLLLTSSLFVAIATGSTATSDTKTAPKFFRAAAACAFAFMGLKAVEYHALLAQNFSPATNLFYEFFFALTALHLGHVIIGTALLLTLAEATKKPSAEKNRFRLIESAACFWHMVDILWIIIFPLFYLIA